MQMQAEDWTWTLNLVDTGQSGTRTQVYAAREFYDAAISADGSRWIASGRDLSGDYFMVVGNTATGGIAYTAPADCNCGVPTSPRGPR